MGVIVGLVWNLPVEYNSLTTLEKKNVREAYASLQNNLCFFCGRNLNSTPIEDVEINWGLFPGGKEGFLRHPVHLQHDHNTGLTEGAVHAFCNAKWWILYGR